MEATFLNTERSEYDRPEHSAPPTGRAVYVCWHPDQLRLSTKWVQEFKERLDGFGEDECGVPMRSNVRAEPGVAGEVNVAARDGIDVSALGEATDFVAVLTGSYFARELQARASELSWAVGTILARGQPLVIWVAALEAGLTLKRRLGQRDLRDFARWHALTSELLRPFPFPSDEDARAAQEFGGALNEAIERLRKHGVECRVCV